MTLIILLLVLITERVGLQAPHWQVQTYLNYYIGMALPKLSKAKASPITLLLFIGAPAVGLYLFLYLLNSGLITFIVSLLALAICIGNPQSRALYKQYLNAVERGDTQAEVILHSQLEQEPTIVETEHKTDTETATEQAVNDNSVQESIGETLIWINFRYYAAPIFYFVLFGAPGVVLYSTLLYLVEFKEIDQCEELENCDAHNQKLLKRWLEWSFWLPSRLVSLGFMVVGHFSYGLETWLKYAVNISKSSKEMLCQVAMSAEKHKDGEGNNAEKMVKLTKRNMSLFIVVIAVLTLLGSIM